MVRTGAVRTAVRNSQQLDSVSVYFDLHDPPEFIWHGGYFVNITACICRVRDAGKMVQVDALQ
eukprot:m.1036351 g.1036351  ORF g.1036351 m.1036351 type:complete len:63 (+) comp24139_c2_seq17:2594-2782(+)